MERFMKNPSYMKKDDLTLDIDTAKKGDLTLDIDTAKKGDLTLDIDTAKKGDSVETEAEAKTRVLKKEENSMRRQNNQRSWRGR